MKSEISTVVLIGFIGVAVFGFSQMPFSGARGASHYVCIAAAVQNAACPPESSGLSSIAFHVNAFKLFSSVSFGSYGFAAAILVLMFALIFVFSFRIPNINPSIAPQLFRRVRKLSDLQYPPPNILRLTRWLAIHENSPTAP